MSLSVCLSMSLYLSVSISTCVSDCVSSSSSLSPFSLFSFATLQHMSECLCVCVHVCFAVCLSVCMHLYAWKCVSIIHCLIDFLSVFSAPILLTVCVSIFLTVVLYLRICLADSLYYTGSLPAYLPLLLLSESTLSDFLTVCVSACVARWLTDTEKSDCLCI